MAPKAKSQGAVLDLCSKITQLGNKISIHILEFLSTVKNQPHDFDNLAHNFLDICRMLWSIEAGLSESLRTRQVFPDDMLQELDREFRTTQTSFTVLDQMLLKLLEYEKRGAVGKFQRGWRRMFADNDIEKMLTTLGKTKEALSMSSLMFQWSLGDGKIEESIGIGYTGLAAALDRMDRGRSTASATRLDSLPRDLDEPQLPALPPLSPVGLLDHHKASATDLMAHEDADMRLAPQLRHHPSVSQHTVSSAGHRERVRSVADSAERPGLSIDKRESGTTSAAATDVETLIEEMDAIDMTSNKVIRLTADPLTMPRWTPRSTIGGTSPAHKTTLMSAIHAQNHKMVEQLLDRGVAPDTSPDFHFLNDAIRNHDAETVRLLLLFGADTNALDRHGVSSLLAAVESSFTDGAAMLVKYGADPNLAAGPESESPMAMAVAQHKIHLARLLLTYGGDPNHMLTCGNTVLIKAIDKKSPKKLVDLLLDYGSDPNGKNREGKTALFEAITSGRVDIVTSLLDHGANPNLPGPKHMLWPSAHEPACLQILLARGADWKKTPGIMELAASINNIESVRLLLKAGVDPNAKKDGAYTPLCTSIRDNRPDIFQLLLANGADPNVPASEYPAFKCVTHFRPQYLPALIKAGADLNNPRGIVEMAVQMNNTEALLYLLDQGVSPNDKSPKGHTPLTTAIRENRVETVDVLLARGADPNVRGEDWPVCMAVRQPTMLKRLLPCLAQPRAFKGVIEMAVVANQLESIRLLLQAGVSVEDRNGGVFSPLTTAIREDRKEITRFLLDEGGADPNAPGEHLPIVKAVRRFRDGDTDIIEMLLDRGADPNKVYRGWNAVMQAIENGDGELLRLFVNRGLVDVEQKDDTGRTIMEIAESRGWDEAVEILTKAL